MQTNIAPPVHASPSSQKNTTVAPPAGADAGFERAMRDANTARETESAALENIWPEGAKPQRHGVDNNSEEYETVIEQPTTRLNSSRHRQFHLPNALVKPSIIAAQKPLPSAATSAPSADNVLAEIWRMLPVSDPQAAVLSAANIDRGDLLSATASGELPAAPNLPLAISLNFEPAAKFAAEPPKNGSGMDAADPLKNTASHLLGRQIVVLDQIQNEANGTSTDHSLAFANYGDADKNLPGIPLQTTKSAPLAGFVQEKFTEAALLRGISAGIGHTSGNLTTTPSAVAAPIQTTLSTPLGQPGWTNELGASVLRMISRDIAGATLKINPEHLGPIDIAIDMIGKNASISFVAATPEARQALEQSLPQLAQMLSDSGLSLSQSSVDQKNQTASRSGGGTNSGAWSGQQANSESEDDQQPAKPMRVSLGNVDTFA